MQGHTSEPFGFVLLEGTLEVAVFLLKQPLKKHKNAQSFSKRKVISLSTASFVAFQTWTVLVFALFLGPARGRVLQCEKTDQEATNRGQHFLSHVGLSFSMGTPGKWLVFPLKQP